MPASSNDNAHPLAERFCTFVKRSKFPCVGAKSAVAKGQIEIIVARDISSTWDDVRIYSALMNFAHDYRRSPKLYQSFVVLFEEVRTLSEQLFEQQLWSRLQSLSEKDAWHGQRYDPRVSADPASPHFSLSFGGEGFFVVGLHPNASRRSRRFRAPALVFNLHAQFDVLRNDGIYEKLRSNILERDLAFSGSPNPMLARHGESSEARQYSGRAVHHAWACPLARPPTKAPNLAA